jgi:hypothetical protein
MLAERLQPQVVHSGGASSWSVYCDRWQWWRPAEMDRCSRQN